LEFKSKKHTLKDYSTKVVIFVICILLGVLAVFAPAYFGIQLLIVCFYFYNSPYKVSGNMQKSFSHQCFILIGGAVGSVLLTLFLSAGAFGYLNLGAAAY
jgi:hypothetical protein